MLISDHINLTADSPLEGATFIDLTDLYSRRLRDLARSIAPGLDEGVYCQFRGPHYETPAEVQMAKAIGGHIVGMSTALEAIAARQAGMEILGMSLVTTLAAGIQQSPLSHHEVLEAGKHAKVPVWVAFELSLREAGVACAPVPVVDDRGALLPAAIEVLEAGRAAEPVISGLLAKIVAEL